MDVVLRVALDDEDATVLRVPVKVLGIVVVHHAQFLQNWVGALMAQQHHPFLNWEGIGQVRPLRPEAIGTVTRGTQRVGWEGWGAGGPWEKGGGTAPGWPPGGRGCWPS